jgi:hypothetical protein
MSRHHHKIMARIIQWGLSLAALAYIAWRMMHFKDWELFFDTIYHQRWPLTGILFLQLALAAINVSLECIKWRQLSGIIVQQSWHNTVYQVIKGIQTGMISPARAGEPLVKGLLLRSGLRTKGFLLSATGSIIQNMVLMLGGLAGIIFTQNHLAENNTIFSNLQKGILDYTFITLVTIMTMAILLYLFAGIFRARPLVRKIVAHLRTIAQLGAGRTMKISAVTIMRYAIYNFQLWLMLWFFDVSGSLSDLGLIMTYYAAITLLPTMAVADLGIRSSIALFLFGMLSSNSAGIVASVFLIWIINLALPSIIAVIMQPRDEYQ